MWISWIIALGIITGQLIKLPNSNQGISLLDIAVIILDVGLIKNYFKLKKPSKFLWAGIIFIAIQVISLFFTPLKLNPSEYLTSFLYTVRFSLYLLTGFLVYKANITKTLLFSGFMLACIGLLQLILLPDLSFLQQFGWDPHYFRTVSTFLDPNFLGAFLVLTLLILVKEGSDIIGNQKLYYLTFAIIYITLVTTFSRSAYGMLVISFLSLAFLMKSMKIVILTAVLLLGIIISYGLYTKTISQPRNIDRSQSASFRLSTWQQGWQLFQSSPLLGVGFNAYKYGLAEHNLADKTFLSSHGASSNDSSLLFVLSTTGIIGLISYLFFLGFLIGNFKSNLLLTSALLGLLAQSFFTNSLFYPPILLWLVLIKSSYK